MLEHIYNFKGKNTSLSVDMNLLMNFQNIYLMDNHRAALWCWLQKLNLKRKSKYDLLHLDAHYDLSQSGVSRNAAVVKKLPTMTFADYEGYIDVKDQEVKLFRWDNYFTFFLEYYQNYINTVYTCTHKIHASDSKMTVDKYKIQELESSRILEQLQNIFDGEDDKRWIINIDFDFFYIGNNRGDRYRLFSREVEKEIAQLVKELLANNKIEILTLCLSPECCRSKNTDQDGGWGNALSVAMSFLDDLECKHNLDKL